jgi:hypothetical protein
MMSENKMGYRGSKSENTDLATVKTISVKEQRVDGSCFGFSPQLRCTLMGFERYYQISIPSNQIIIQTFTGQVKSPRLKRCFHTQALLPLLPPLLPLVVLCGFLFFC